MKTRQGFVSNSSSTSFVVIVPSNFQLSADDISLLKGNYRDKNNDEETREISDVEVIGMFQETVKRTSFNDLYDDCYFNVYTLFDVFKKYSMVLHQFETGSDNGDSITFITQADMDRVTKIIEAKAKK